MGQFGVFALVHLRGRIPNQLSRQGEGLDDCFGIAASDEP